MGKRVLGLFIGLLLILMAVFALIWNESLVIETVTRKLFASDHSTSTNTATTVNHLKVPYSFQEYEFAFVTSYENDNSLYIEATLSGILDDGYAIPTGNLEARGVQVPASDNFEITRFKLDPKLTSGIYVNSTRDIYSFVTSSEIINMNVE